LFSIGLCVLGVPATITSVRGPQFTSNVWAALCGTLSISHCQTTAYHLEANGAIDRLHHHLKDALSVPAAMATRAEEILWVLLSLHSQPREAFTWLKQFLEPPLCYPMNFCKMKNFLLIILLTNFPKS
jgi:hypothetical protein